MDNNSINITGSVADPVSATIQSICTAVAGVCAFLSTPEGQLVCKEARENNAAFKVEAASVWSSFIGVFKK